MGKRISLKTICVSATVSILIFHTFITIISSDIQGVEGSNNEEGTFDDISREEKLQDMMDKDDMNEVMLEDGRKFKLFEKKRLQHKKAQTFCKNREGKLVRAMNNDEMKRLQLLLMRARMVGDQIWIGADKKLWKKYSKKMTGMDRPNLGPDVMSFGGGGPTDMCPALSTSTRSLIPAPCYNQLPFICEFDPGKGKKKKTSGNKTKTGKNKSKNKNAGKAKMRDEMRRKREILSMPFTTDANGNEETEEDLEGSNSTSTMTSVLDFDTSKDGIGPTPPLSSTNNPDEDFILSHKIAFHPHVISALQNTSEYSIPSDEAQTTNYKNVNDLQERTIPNKRLATGDVLKFSTKRMLQTPLNDPDQQMLDLINEQSVNMLDDTNTTEELNNMTNVSGFSEKLMSPLKENSITPDPEPEPVSEPLAEPDSNSIADAMSMSTSRSDISSTSDSVAQSMITTSPDLGRGTRSFSQPTGMPVSTVTMAQNSGTTVPETVSATGTQDSGTNPPHSTMPTVDASTMQMGEATTNMAMTSGRYTMTTSADLMMQPRMTTTADSSKIRPEMTNTLVSTTTAMNSIGDQMSTTISSQGNSADPMSTPRIPDQMPSTGSMMSTTPSAGLIMSSTVTTTGPMVSTLRMTTTENSITKTTIPSMNTTPQSMTANAPKTTIDPMTKPMPTASPTSADGLSAQKPETDRGGKSFSEPGKLTPVVNGATDKMTSDSPHKEVHHNMSLSSLLHPRGTVPPTKVSGSTLTSTSTHSPAALLTLRVKPTMRSRSSKERRVATTRRSGESPIIPTMKSSIPTLLKPQNSSNPGNLNVMPHLNKLVAG